MALKTMAARGQTRAQTQEQRPGAGRIGAFLVFALLVFLTVFPFWWLLRTAFSTEKLIYTNTTSLWPVGFTFSNFARVLGLLTTQEAVALGGSGASIHFLLFMRNSFIVSAVIVVGQVFFGSMAAFAFARLHFPGRDTIFFIFLMALMVPGVVTLIPNFVLIRQLNWLDTFQGIVAPTFLMTPFAIFFLRQFFLGINHEVEEAAKIDGAGYFRLFTSIILPMGRSALSTLAVLTFLGEWNDYFWPFLIGKAESVRVLTAALAIFKSQTPQGAPDWGGLMAGTALSILPILLLFIAAGRQIMDSIQFSGIK
jgi:multiple sugar transport system permease protein